MSSKRYTVFLIGLACLLSPALLFAQEKKEESPVSAIRSIQMYIDGLPAPTEMRDLIPLKEGEAFSLKNISESIRKLYKTGLFFDVQVESEGQDRIDLIYRLQKRFFVRKIIFYGNRDIPSPRLADGIEALKEGSPFSSDKLNRAENELGEILKSEGYLEARIETRTEKESDTSNIDILFDITSSDRYIVSEIQFEGDLIIDESKIRRRMETKEGREYRRSILDKDIGKIRQIFRDLDYRQVEIEVTRERLVPEEKSVELVLKIFPRDKIEVFIEGADVPLSLIKPIWEARIFEEWGLSEGEAKIMSHLRKKGYLFPQIDSSIEQDENSMKVYHRINKGRRYSLSDMEFRGLTHFTPAQIKYELEIHDKIPFFSRTDGARLFELPLEIEFLYKTQGFSSTRVELQFDLREKKAVPVFYVEEGNQETIENIRFEGVSLFTPDNLLEQITSRAAGPFFQPNIQKDIGELETFYLNQGVRGSEIRAMVEVSGDNRYSIRFQVSEGRFVRVDRVIIAGNNVTRRNTILREVTIVPGEYAFYESIQESKRSLEQLGIFSEVKIEEIPISDNTENILIRVREGERNYASLGLGLETKNEPRSFAIWNNPVRLRGTAEFIRNNIFGSAYQLSLVGQISIKEQRLVLSWEQPYFFGIPMESFVNFWIEREVRSSYSFDRRGLSFSVIRPLSQSDNLVLLSTLRLAQTTLFDLEIPEDEVDRQHFPYSTTSLSGSLIWDRRSDPFNPESGFFLSSVVEWAYPLFRTESDYLKWFSKYQHYVPIIPGMTFIGTARLGLGRGRMPIHERFFGGGSNSFRGVQFDELGPKDTDSLKPIGGKALLLLNLELTFPLVASLKELYGVVFYDMGNVFFTRKQVSWTGLRDAVGFGLRYKTPLGPIRLEIGWNLDPPEGQSKALIFVSIGNVF